MNGNKRITFMTYDYEHHRIAIVNIPGLTTSKTNVGLAHVAFGFDNLSDLATSYEHKKAHGIKPSRCANHGMSTSIYYDDPDGNGIETQVDNFDTHEEGMQFIKSDGFADDPFGAPFDPEEFVRRVRSGEDEKVIKKRPDVEKRDVEKTAIF